MRVLLDKEMELSASLRKQLDVSNEEVKDLQADLDVLTKESEK